MPRRVGTQGRELNKLTAGVLLVLPIGAVPHSVTQLALLDALNVRLASLATLKQNEAQFFINLFIIF